MHLWRLPVDRCVSVNRSGTSVNTIVGTTRYQSGLNLDIEV